MNRGECLLLELVRGFLEVAVHQVLYHRRVYAHRAFHRDRHYGVHTRLCTDVQVKAYIVDAMHSFNALMAKAPQLVHKLVICITSPAPAPAAPVTLEQFVFQFKNIPSFHPLNKLTISDEEAEELCGQFAQTLVKL